MRKLLFLSLAVLMTAGCAKEKFSSTPCNFDCKVDEVKGSKVYFTVTPDNMDACYAYGLLSTKQEEAQWTDTQLVDWQLGLMKEIYEAMKEYEKTVDTFIDRFCFKGTRSFKIDRLETDSEYIILLFQVNPKTLESIGPLIRIPFKTVNVPHYDISFEIHTSGKDNFTLIPSDTEHTWYWEYEDNDRIALTYGTPYYFYYDVIGLFEEYNFLDNLLCKGDEIWTFSEDDPGVKEGHTYTLIASGCEDGEITSNLHFASFSLEDGELIFHETSYTDIPVVKL